MQNLKSNRLRYLWLICGSGADALDGGNGNDQLNGGADDDLLQGGLGSDDYHFTAGDGIDTLVEGSLSEPLLADPDSIDRVVFDASVQRDEVSLLRGSDGSLTVNYGVGNETTLAGQYQTGGNNIEAITFADGQQITKAQLDALQIGVREGTANNDTLYGSTGNDVIRGHEGTDFLDGGRRGHGTGTVSTITGSDLLDGGRGGGQLFIQICRV